MDKFIIRAMALPLVIFLVASVSGIQINRNARVANMPLEILYDVVLSDNVWPDHYYTSNFDMPEPRSLHFNGYWTFEPSNLPFSGPIWVFHTNELVLKEVNYTVNQVTR
jgi:hypothetical protein